MQIQNSTKIYSGFFVRLAAYFIDNIIIGAVLMIIRFPMWIVSIVSPDNIFMKPILFKFSAWNILLYLIGVIYFVLMTYYTGATLGKKLFQLKVIPSSGEKLTMLNLFYRETIGRYLSSLMFLGYLLIAVDHEKRGLHDILSDTRVIYTNTITLTDIVTVPYSTDIAPLPEHDNEASDPDPLEETIQEHFPF